MFRGTHCSLRRHLSGYIATLPLPARFQGALITGRIDAKQQQFYDRFGVEVRQVRFGQPNCRYLRSSAHL